MEKVSVIVPVFDAEPYLRGCIHSILDQSYGNIELVLVNDGSTDSSLQICRDFAAANSNIIVVDKTNTGQADSRFVGFAHSTGSYIYCVDSDDSVHPDAVEVLVRGLEDSGSDIYCCRYRLVDDAGKELRVAGRYSVETMTGRNDIVNDALRAVNVKPSLCLKICRRRLWNEACNPLLRTIRFNEDYPLTVMLSLHARRVGFTNRVLYNVLQRPGSVSRIPRPDMVRAHELCFQLLSSAISEAGIGAEGQSSLAVGYAKNMFNSLLIAARNTNSYSEFSKIYRSIAPDSIYHRRDFRKRLAKASMQYCLADTFTRAPLLFSFFARVFAGFRRH